MNELEKLLFGKSQKVDLPANVPLYLRESFGASRAKFAGSEFYILAPSQDLSFTEIKKQFAQIIELTGLKCILHLETLSEYQRNSLISSGIPFVFSSKQIFVPFLGVALTNRFTRAVVKNDSLTFATQKLILMSLYRDLNHQNVAQIAAKLGVSSTYIVRSFDELDAHSLGLTKYAGRSRVFVNETSHFEFWENIKPILRSPYKKRISFPRDEFKKIAKKLDSVGCVKSGISALSHYSNLSEGSVRKFAVTREVAKIMTEIIAAKPRLRHHEQIEVGVLGYPAGEEFRKKFAGYVDPLSATLLLSRSELKDERVLEAVEAVERKFLK